MEEFIRGCNEFNYSFQRRVNPKSTTYCKIPVPTGRARSVKNITWAGTLNVVAHATIATNPDSKGAVWEVLDSNAVLSPAVTALKFVNNRNDYGELFAAVIME